MSEGRRPALSPKDYTVGWISPLPVEMAAGMALLDEEHSPVPQDEHDTNTYTLGRVGVHNVVIACLPSGVTGINSAGKVAMQMRRSFKRLSFGLMVGIGGGVPGEEKDIRLGDIAVGLPMESHGGTIQYDFGKTTQDGKFDRGGTPHKPPSIVLTALTKLRARHMMVGHDISKHLLSIYDKFPAMKPTFARPDNEYDILYEYDYDHPRGFPDCSQCDRNRLVVRESRLSNIPVLHYGLIASGNQVMRHGATRETLRQELGAICFEMEGAGPSDDLPCLVIRGICDYSDSHKNKRWQSYAAAVAACYAKELLSLVPVVEVYIDHAVTAAAISSEKSVHSRSSTGIAEIEQVASSIPRHTGPRILQSHDSGGGIFIESPKRLPSDWIHTGPASASQIGHYGGWPNRSSIVTYEKREVLEALKKFRSFLTAQQLASFHKVNFQTLRDALVRIQREQAAKSQSMNLPRVQPFLKGLEQINRGLEFAKTSEFVSTVLGAVRFSIQTARRSRKALDTLLKAYEKIGEAINFAESHPIWDPEYLQKVPIFVRICVDVLEFHQLVLQIYGIPTWWLVFDNIWKASASRMDYLIDDIRRYREFSDGRATASALSDYHQKRQVAAQDTEQLVSTEKRNQWFATQQWLVCADSQQDHEDVSKPRHEIGIRRSGQWLFKHPLYVPWRMDDVPKTPILWVSGILGAGKTVLASSIIDDCREAVDAHAAFFYCRHGDSDRTTFVPILRSIIRQLLSLDNLLLPWCYEQFVNSNQLCLTNEKACRNILRMLLLNAKKVFLIFDGVDECERSVRRLLLDFFNQMIMDCDKQDPGILRILFISRPEDDIRRNLQEFSEIALKTTDHEHDVGKYISGWCHKIRVKFEEIEDPVVEYILTSTRHRAEGMYLFAELVMKNLYQQVSLERLLEQVHPDLFPKGLGEAYSRIFERIGSDQDSQEVEIARRVLGWMALVRRPLKWHEVQAAISTNIAEGTMDIVRHRSRKHIREICGSLINDLSGDRLELVHSTAKTFLLESAFITPALVESELTTLCLSYLTFECFDEDLAHQKRTESVLQGHFALQDYALAHWADHVSTIIRAGPSKLQEHRSILDDFGNAVVDFVAHYGLSLQENSESEEAGKGCLQFRDCAFYDDLCHLSRLTHRLSARSHQAFDDICPKLLEPALAQSRSILEEHANSPSLDEKLRKDLRAFYGTKWYKCPKAACYYFHEGFLDAKSKEHHIIRHEHPFRCKYEACEMGHRLGFTSQKLLDKHLAIYHPEDENLVATFSRIKKSRERVNDSNAPSPSRTSTPTKFECPECARCFTRMSSLNRHLLAEAKERPFQCSTCDKRFGQDNDRKRHEKEIHSGEKPFICGGTSEDPTVVRQWGCGKAFPRAAALSSHLRSIAGQSCLQPLVNDDNRDEEYQNQWTSVNGGEFPQQIYEQYPDLREPPVELSTIDARHKEKISSSSFTYNSTSKSWSPFRP